MSDPNEVSLWRLRRIWHEQELASPRRVRYMADVRHPLKPIIHADKGIGWRKYRRPINPIQTPPLQMAKCAKCGELVSVSDHLHPCFSQRVWSHLK